MYYKPVKNIIDVVGLAKIIINVVVIYYDLPESIISNRGLLLTSKFWSSPCYFFDIKWKLSTVLHLQIDNPINRQKSIMKVDICVFVI